MADGAGERVELSFIPPGAPCRNGDVKSFDAALRPVGAQFYAP
jgi:hypothetical protein